MATVSTLVGLPASTYVGDTLLFKVTDGNFPADAWTLEYHFRSNEGSAITLTGTTSGTSHLFSIAPATTATWVAGDYSGIGRAIDAQSGKITFWQGRLSILPELAVQAAEYDSRSWAQRCLDKINAVIEGKAGRDVLNSTIAGQSIGRMSPEQLFAMRDRFASEVASELAKEAANRGESTGRNIVYRFTTP
jgi:hypothetical protein